MKKTREEQGLVKSRGFAVIELEDSMLEDVMGGLPDINGICKENSGNCVAGCACPPAA